MFRRTAAHQPGLGNPFALQFEQTSPSSIHFQLAGDLRPRSKFNKDNPFSAFWML
jgi:hypothetical protein